MCRRTHTQSRRSHPRIIVFNDSMCHHLCSMDTSIIEPCSVWNVSDTRVVCIFKNFLRVHVSCPFQCCRVRANRPSLCLCHVICLSCVHVILPSSPHNQCCKLTTMVSLQASNHGFKVAWHVQELRSQLRKDSLK